MKKIWMALMFMASFTILLGCKPEGEDSVDEGPDSITIELSGLAGQGTLDQPYVLELNVGETIEKHMAIEGTYEEIEYIFGRLENDKFVADETTKNIDLTPRSKNDYLSVKATSQGESMLRIKGKDMSSSAYVKVSAVTRDGSTEDIKDYSKSLRVLAIGNSFSEDAMTYLGEIANDYGMEDFVIAYLYIGGASLETHWTTVSNGTSSYRYEKNVENEWENKGNKSLLIGLLDEEWDIVTFQQVSGYSGMTETFQPYLDNLIDYVNTNKLTDTTFMWHQTWAYAQSSTHSSFPNYNSDQITMYEAIADASQNYIAKDSRFRQVIPAGTAIQNVRTSVVGDHVNRDGYHLNSYGRFVAGLMWFRTITGFSIDDITYKPNNVTEEQLEIAKEAVNHAYDNMYEVTNSSYK